MARIEKTVFISYRRKDISWALAVYQYLMSQKYDVFFDYTSLSGGDFEQVIISNIKARAHFILILTPTALDRCDQPGDWLRREIETAIDEKRNIIPLFFEGFNFGAPSITKKLTGKLVAINRYNGLDVPGGYFIEAMERLCSRYLNLPLNSVLHPISTDVRRKVSEEKIAANNALLQKREDIQKLIRPALEEPKQLANKKAVEPPNSLWRLVESVNVWRPYIFGAGILLLVVLGFFGVRSLTNSSNAIKLPLPTQSPEVGNESTPISTKQNPANTAIIPFFTLTPTKSASILSPTLTATHTSTIPSFTPNPPNGTVSTMTGNDGMMLLYIPAGSFEMGGENHDEDEKPIHEVTLYAFWIDMTEVTNAMYALCVDAGNCVEPLGNSHYPDSKYANHPVTSVSWVDANAYCIWADRRLPTEAEWEKAARGETNFIYPWGNNLPDENLLNFNSHVGDTTEVGAYPKGASPYGALDMAGNVWEWVNDWYSANYYLDPLSSSNPFGPDSGSARVFRGGSWKDTEYNIRSANRGMNSPTEIDSAIGFRCAMDASK